MDVNYHKSLCRALEGNRGVWFNWSQNLIAVWDGARDLQVFQTDAEVVTYLHNIVMSHEPTMDEVEVKLASRGFDRQGRVPEPEMWS